MGSNSQLYKISFWSVIKPGIWPFTVLCISIAGFFPIVVLTNGTDFQSFALVVAIVWIAITGIPPFILAINYLTHDRHTVLEIDQSNNNIRISRRNNIYTFPLEDILRIEKYHSNIVKGETMTRMHWHTFYFYKLVLRQHESVEVSRMIIEKFERKIENVRFEYIRTSFPLIRH